MTQQNDDPLITLPPLPLSAINVILMGLDELPGKVSRRLVGFIQKQVTAHLEPPTAPAEVAKDIAADLKAEASKQTVPVQTAPDAPAAAPEAAPEPTPEPAA
jgi:hypothetical protein